MAEPEEIRVIPNDYRHYRPLNRSKKEIRMLRIEPSKSPKDPLICHLHRADLHNPPPYTALSYVWGSFNDTLEFQNPRKQNRAGSSLSEDAADPDASVEQSAADPRSPIGQVLATDQQASDCRCEGGEEDPTVWVDAGAQTGRVDGFRITQSLYAGLRSLRMQNSSSVLVWADMLCLNQFDKSERSHQVGLMSQIFSGAKQVAVWLGGDPEIPSDILIWADDSLLALTDLLRTTHTEVSHLNVSLLDELETKILPLGPLRSQFEAFISMVRRLPLHSRSYEWSPDSEPTPESTYVVDALLIRLYLRRDNPAGVAYLRCLLDPDSSVWRFYHLLIFELAFTHKKRAVLDALSGCTAALAGEFLVTTFSRLFQLPWFGRVWVYSEVSSSPRIYVQHGMNTLGWDAVVTCSQVCFYAWAVSSYDLCSSAARPKASILYSIAQAQSHCDDVSARLDKFGRLTKLWGSKKYHSISLCRLLKLTSVLQATVPRDKLYAIYDLASDLPSSAFMPDYHQTQHESYANFTRCVIKTTGNLQILSLLSASTRLTDCSWVPQYDRLDAGFGGLDQDTSHNPYRASSNRMAQHIECARERSVVLQGICLANVQHCVVMDGHTPCRHYMDYLTSVRREVFGSGEAVIDTDDEASHLSIEVFVCLWLSMAYFCNLLETVVVTADNWQSMYNDSLAYLCYEMNKAGRTTQLSVVDLFLVGHYRKPPPTHFPASMGPPDEKVCVFFTSDGTIGHCTRPTRRTDKVVVLDGGSVLYVLRQRPSPTAKGCTRAEAARRGLEFELGGECYLHGHMDDKILEGPRWKENDPLYVDPIDYDPAMETPGGKGFTKALYRKRPFVIT
ncbi:hypothetical protein H2200_004839 [Cladophialophora chaetospira]|uniref:Heterokaryon incompatibility domain-containing protein n=1 Tax=Cladophialophora chaetospira TaxID=386627 RepID=A0AA38XE05_9EURO|nr:hypothetical protein H2200_004839 [Cladophialophora chaetospira]